VDDARKVGGRSFQTRGSETAKLRDPYVIVLVLVLGTIRSPRAAERRQRRPVLAATGTRISVRYRCRQLLDNPQAASGQTATLV